MQFVIANESNGTPVLIIEAHNENDSGILQSLLLNLDAAQRVGIQHGKAGEGLPIIKMQGLDVVKIKVRLALGNIEIGEGLFRRRVR